MNGELNHNSSVPLYKQIIKGITDSIASHEYEIGDKLPTENELMARYGVSRITVRTAMSELVEDGVLERRRGKGTFVATPKSLYSADDRIGFTRSCMISGKVPMTKLISLEVQFPTEKIARFLEQSEHDEVICSRRLRYVDGNPAMLETNYYPMSYKFLFEENLNNSLFDILARHNIVVADGLRTIEICEPTLEELHILNMKSRRSLLLFKDRQLDEKRRPLFFSKQLYCTDRMKFYL